MSGAESLAKFMAEEGVTQEDLAKIFDVSPIVIEEWCSFEVNCTATMTLNVWTEHNEPKFSFHRPIIGEVCGDMSAPFRHNVRSFFGYGIWGIVKLFHFKNKAFREFDELFRLVTHGGGQIADTGDFGDVTYEITNGKVSFLTKDEDKDTLQNIVDVLNNSGVKFYEENRAQFELDCLKSDPIYQNGAYMLDILGRLKFNSLDAPIRQEISLLLEKLTSKQ